MPNPDPVVKLAADLSGVRVSERLLPSLQFGSITAQIMASIPEPDRLEVIAAAVETNRKRSAEQSPDLQQSVLLNDAENATKIDALTAIVTSVKEKLDDQHKQPVSAQPLGPVDEAGVLSALETPAKATDSVRLYGAAWLTSVQEHVSKKIWNQPGFPALFFHAQTT